ncbi:MAG: GTP 3',8-cyclase MoaA [bacterium]
MDIINNNKINSKAENSRSDNFLIDGFGRQITYLRISLTDRCNLRCVYCMPEDGVKLIEHSEMLSYEEILKFVNILASHGVNKIRITGGEPLVRKGMINFIENLSSISGIKDISMTTNGILLDKYAQDLYNAGLKRINISLDSLNNETFSKITRGGNLDAVLKGISAAKAAGFEPIKINTVLIRGTNDNELMNFISFAIENELNLRFIEYMPIGQNISRTITTKELTDKIKAEYKDFESNKISDSSVSKEYYFSNNKNNKAVIGFISPLSEHFCNNCNRLRLTASGKLRLCLFYDEEYDIKKILNNSVNDEDIYNYLLNVLQKKHQTHLFNNKIGANNCSGHINIVEDNTYMNKIGG